MFNDTLIKMLEKYAKAEKKAKHFKKLVRIKGIIIKKSLTKNQNIRLKIKIDDDEFTFIVIKSHKDKFALAEKLVKGDYVSIAGIPKFRMIICTKLLKIRHIDESKQTTLLTAK